MTPAIKLYSTADAREIPWHEASNLDDAKKEVLKAYLIDGVRKYIQNIETKFYVLQVNNVFLPVTVNDGQYENAYTASPYTHYISYAKQELGQLDSPALITLLTLLLTVMGWFFKACKINKVVVVNNWLLSTNLYPQGYEEHVETIIQELIGRFPQHAIVFRSLNEKTEAKGIERLMSVGCLKVLSRQVYFVDGKIADYLQKRDFKKDEGLFNKTPYRLYPGSALQNNDIPRIQELYQLLYMHKYSCHNPNFTEDFIRIGLSSRFLKIQALRNPQTNQIDGVIGFIEQEDTMTTPLAGYALDKPKDAGLYRLLTLLVLKAAAQQRKLFNMSSGAAHFKRMRGATPALEYSAIYIQHLPLYQKLPWCALSLLTNSLGVKLISNY